jgi:hypothetical protein
VYVIAGGGLTVSGNARVTGAGVMVYNAGGPGGAFGAVSVTGNATVDLAAMASGTYAGVVLFQSRDNDRAMMLGGNGSVALHRGIVYAPAALLSASGGVELDASLAVGRLQLAGNARIV